MSGLFVQDIVERDTSDANSSSNQSFESPAEGFPAPKRRPKVSAFKARRLAAAADAKGEPAPAPRNEERAGNDGNNDGFYAKERRRIDKENRRTIESMTPAEIEEARRELVNGLNPSILQRLMQRANIDDETTGKSPFDPSPETGIEPPPEILVEDSGFKPNPESATAAQTESNPFKQALSKGPNPQPINEDRAPDRPPEDLFPISDQPEATMHFPKAQDPELDPSDPDFLQSLHEKYFPNLSADPTKMAWMAPIPTEDSPADKASPYHPDQASLSSSALRFDFKGKLLPPRLSRSIPVSKGLHHHGLAPEAAGYTVEELSILARSAVAAQRCIAFQTLGRILFRLGQGEWGLGQNDPIAMGTWTSIKQGRVLESLWEAAGQEHGHRSSQAYAIEALWLFEKGGWKEKWSGR